MVAGYRIRARRKHGMDGIEAPAPPGALRTVLIEIKPQRKRFALAHERCGGNEVIGLDVIERADFVIRSPFAPVFQTLGRRLYGAHCDVLLNDILRHHFHRACCFGL